MPPPGRPMMSGKRLFERHSCWAKKGQRRYRYFVSKRLVRGTAKPDERGWRLPAERTEMAIMVGTRQMLSDRGALASTLKACGFAAAELKQAVDAIDNKVKSDEQVETTADRTLIERVELRRDGMQITLNLRALLPPIRFPAGGPDLRMTRLVPLQMKRRGVEHIWCSQARCSSADRSCATSSSGPRVPVVRRTGGGNCGVDQADRSPRTCQRQLCAPSGAARAARSSNRGMYLRRAAKRLPLRRASEDSGWCSDRMGRPAAAFCGLESRASSLPTTQDHRSSERRSVGHDRTESARGTESLLNREESGRIGDLQDWSLSPLPRAERISPLTREFAAISRL